MAGSEEPRVPCPLCGARRRASVMLRHLIWEHDEQMLVLALERDGAYTRLVLVRVFGYDEDRKASIVVAEPQPPYDLRRAAIEKVAGPGRFDGLYPLDEALEAWFRKRWPGFMDPVDWIDEFWDIGRDPEFWDD